MPLRLKDPRKGWSSNYSIRGSYLGVQVNKTCGTPRRAIALAQLKRLEADIERGEYPPPEQTAADSEQPTFIDAAHAYVEAGRRRKYVARLVQHFGAMRLTEIDQVAIDAAAIAICPNTTNGTRNACVYTPISAILHHAGIDIKIRRPKGAKGRIVTDWLPVEDARAITRQADVIAADFGLFLRVLLYSGLRLNEAMKLRWDDVDLNDINEAQAWARRSKGGVASPVRLRPDLAGELLAHRPAEAHGRVFRFHAGGHLKHLLTRAKLAALGLPCPRRRPTGWRAPPNRLEWVNFHSFRHTFATWFRKYGGGDVQGLIATGNWSDPRSAARYAHAVAREEWQRVDRLPSVSNS